MAEGRKHIVVAAADEAREKARRLERLTPAERRVIKGSRVGRDTFWENRTFGGSN